MTGFNSKRDAAADKLQEPYDQTALELCNVCGWKTLIPDDGCLNCERAQPAQEPVAWQCREHGDVDWLDCGKENYGVNPQRWVYRKLYTTPPKREWVGLTPEETSGFTQHEMTVVKYVSKVLQEKNT
jgi:hypothetical protein